MTSGTRERAANQLTMGIVLDVVRGWSQPATWWMVRARVVGMIRSPTRWLVAAGLATWLAVGLSPWRAWASPAWLAAHAVFGLGFVVATTRRAGVTTRRAALAIQSAAALVASALAAGSLAPVLLVVVAGQAPALLAPRAAMVWVAAQSSALIMAAAWTGDVLAAAPYLAFQLFALAASHFAEAEARARQALAVASADLAIAHAREGEARGAVERLRLSRELHDSVGHHLTALSLELEIGIHASGDRVGESVHHARQLVRELLAEVRSVVSGMREAAPFDLPAALHVLAAGVASPRIHLALPDAPWTDHAAGHALFRCAQEAVTNTVRHAAAENLWLALVRTADAWTLSARDDGRGSAELRRGNGLTGLGERVAELGGALELDAGRGHGFTLRASVPAAEAP